MAFPRIPVGFQIFVRLLLLVGIFAAHGQASPVWSGGNFTGPDPIPGLLVTLTDTSTAPFRFRVEVKNNRLDPVTILNWGSPLDPSAFDLGIVKFTTEGENTPLNLTRVAGKNGNPDPKSLIEIKPGETLKQNIIIGQNEFDWGRKKLDVKLDRLRGNASVQLEGQWEKVWPKEKKAVIKDLEDGPAHNGSYTGDFASNVVKLADYCNFDPARLKKNLWKEPYLSS
jgi:hypothetical protein